MTSLCLGAVGRCHRNLESTQEACWQDFLKWIYLKHTLKDRSKNSARFSHGLLHPEPEHRDCQVLGDSFQNRNLRPLSWVIGGGTSPSPGTIRGWVVKWWMETELKPRSIRQELMIRGANILGSKLHGCSYTIWQISSLVLSQHSGLGWHQSLPSHNQGSWGHSWHDLVGG